MNHLEKIQAKIFYDFVSFYPVLKAWRDKQDTVAFTNGCFDILHRGHVEYLAEAAGKGDRLIVGLNSNASVKALKGPDRPLVDVESRAVMLASLYMVDAVVIFNEETPYELISKVLPDVLIKGDDYTIPEIAGFDIVLENGGRVETIRLTPGFSTSSIIDKLRKAGDE